jgi:hypothetical protein
MRRDGRRRRVDMRDESIDEMEHEGGVEEKCREEICC